MSKFKKRILVTGIAVMVVAGIVAPGGAQAVTAAELQVQITALLAQIEALQLQLATIDGGTTGTVTGIPSGFTFAQNLSQGSSNTDVMYLQILLNSDAATKLADSGAGSPGNETEYFGPITNAGVIKFQEKYTADVLTPVGLSSGTGFFGPSTRTKANTLVGAGVAVTPPDDGTTPPVVTTPGVLSVSLSGPAGSIIATNQGTVTLLNIVLTGTGTVTGVTLKRLGFSADTSLSAVYLFDGDVRLTDGASISSGSSVNFTDPNGLFVVNGVKTVSVKANMAATAGETVGLQLTDITLSSGTVSGVPVTGNLHAIATSNLATVTIASPVGSGATDAGNDILVWQGNLNSATRNVTFSRLALRQIGSINTSDIGNFRLYINGEQVAQTDSLSADRYATFSFSKVLTTGNKTVKVLADITGGSGRTVQLSLRGNYDLAILDSQYNGNVVATYANGFPFNPSAFTVGAGTITVVKAADSTSTNIILAGTDVSLGTYTFTAYGEQVKVETLLVDFTYVDTSAGGNVVTLRNGRLLVNGSQVGSTTTLDPDSTGTSFTTNFVVNPGSPATVEVRADVFDNDGTLAIAADDTIVVILRQGTTNAVPSESLTPINVPSSDQSANTLTVASGTLALASDTNYGNRNVIVPQTAYKLADFSLTNTNVEGVNVNTLTLSITGSPDTFTEADLTDVYIKYGSSTTPIRSTISDPQAFSVTFLMAKNEVMPIEVYGNILSGNVTATDDTIINVGVTATTVSGQTADVSATPGQTLTAQTSGTITASLNSGRSPVARIVSDNQTIDAAVYNFATVTDSYVITDMTVTASDATAILNVILKNGATELARKPGATSVTFSGLNIAVLADSIETDLTVALELGGVGISAGTTGANIQVSLEAATARSNATGTSAAISGLGNNILSSANYVYAVIPTIARQAVSSTLNTGTVELAEFTINADGGTLGWQELYFTVTKTSGTGEVTVTNATVWEGGTEVAGADTILTLTDLDASGSIAFIATNEQQVSGSKTYTLKATFTATSISSGDNFNTTLGATPLSFASSDTLSTVQGAGNSSLIWTDRSASSHGAGTSDWTNDNSVLSLPLDTWTLSRN
ncbi:MAG: hypothetical protein KJI69_02090 [Patescibacteria group bacterium]|nr:hypothetical protein [Patescibacteria group bacterium]